MNRITPFGNLEQRRPVWSAISEFYRDTELDGNDLKRIAKILRSSPYSDAELDHIMFGEVFPVLIPNLRSVTGEWAGFDLDSLQSAVIERQNRRFKLPSALIAGRSLVRDQWRTVKQLMMEESI